jgi:hypothetical protein
VRRGRRNRRHNTRVILTMDGHGVLEYCSAGVDTHEVPRSGTGTNTKDGKINTCACRLHGLVSIPYIPSVTKSIVDLSIK